jgi:shikimate kinase
MTNDIRRVDAPTLERLRQALGNRSLVFIGMMGAGKTTLGRRVAARLELPFVDLDQEIEKAAALSVTEIFAKHGEAHFRDGERKVIARLLRDGPQVLATGGGAFMNAETRAAIAEAGLSVWIEADPAVLFQRIRHKPTRPLLQNPDPEGVLRRLVAERYPVYALADVTVKSREASKDVMTEEILAVLAAHLDVASPAGATTP